MRTVWLSRCDCLELLIKSLSSVLSFTNFGCMRQWFIVMLFLLVVHWYGSWLPILHTMFLHPCFWATSHNIQISPVQGCLVVALTLSLHLLQLSSLSRTIPQTTNMPYSTNMYKLFHVVANETEKPYLFSHFLVNRYTRWPMTPMTGFSWIFQRAATPYRRKMHNDCETELGRSDTVLANVPNDSDWIRR